MFVRLAELPTWYLLLVAYTAILGVRALRDQRRIARRITRARASHERSLRPGRVGGTARSRLDGVSRLARCGWITADGSHLGHHDRRRRLRAVCPSCVRSVCARLRRRGQVGRVGVSARVCARARYPRSTRSRCGLRLCIDDTTRASWGSLASAHPYRPVARQPGRSGNPCTSSEQPNRTRDGVGFRVARTMPR